MKLRIRREVAAARVDAGRPAGFRILDSSGDFITRFERKKREEVGRGKNRRGTRRANWGGKVSNLSSRI